MARILIFLALVALAFGLAQCAFDSLATYEHNRYLVEVERSNQLKLHENGLTERQALSNALVNSTSSQFIPLNPTPAPTLVPIPTMPGNGTVVVIVSR